MSLESNTFSKEFLADVLPSSLPASCLFCFCSCFSSCLSFSSSFFRTSASSYLVEKRSQDVLQWSWKVKEFWLHDTSTLLWVHIFSLQLIFNAANGHYKPQLTNLPFVDLHKLPKNLEKRLYAFKLKLFNALVALSLPLISTF